MNTKFKIIIALIVIIITIVVCKNISFAKDIDKELEGKTIKYSIV